jgi:hypothetical protein
MHYEQDRKIVTRRSKNGEVSIWYSSPDGNPLRAVRENGQPLLGHEHNVRLNDVSVGKQDVDWRMQDLAQAAARHMLVKVELKVARHALMPHFGRRRHVPLPLDDLVSLSVGRNLDILRVGHPRDGCF